MTGCSGMQPEFWVAAGGVCGDPRACIGGSGYLAPLVIPGTAGTTYWIYAGSTVPIFNCTFMIKVGPP